MTLQQPVSSRRDPEGYAAIGDHGVLGDGRGVALVALDGTVDWWATPRLDAEPVFAALLDPDDGGAFTLRRADPDATAAHRYLPGTNVLETVFRTQDGVVRVLDALNGGTAGALPWSELARRVEGLEGRVPMVCELRPGDGMRRWQPWVETTDRGPVLHAGGVAVGVRADPRIALRTGHRSVSGEFTVSAGERYPIGLVADHETPLYLADVRDIDRRLDGTVEAWRRWSDQVHWPHERSEQVVRSGLALKLLIESGTGAVAAAATTSLPERMGGDKNWDYRFCWIRDATLTVSALDLLGLQEEVHAAVSWLLRAIRENGGAPSVLYTLDAAVPQNVTEVDVPGYRGSRPVRSGNDAVDQLQLGIYGDLFSVIEGWIRAGHVLDVRTRRELADLADLADRCADEWRHDDAGIWELGVNRPYTSSKMNCWRALSIAGRLAEQGHLPGVGGRWREEAELVRAWVDEHCWSERRGAYTFYAGSEDLDASVLLGAQMGFDRGPRMSSTVDAVTADLGEGALLYRYSGMRKEEETFIACAYWRVHAPGPDGPAGRGALAAGRPGRGRHPARADVRDERPRHRGRGGQPAAGAQPPGVRPRPARGGHGRRHRYPGRLGR